MLEKRKLPLVVNLISGPGAGKSTTMAGVFHKLKCMGINAEQAPEFAKDKVYEESFRTMDDQIYIFGKQFHKMWRLVDKVDVIVTDSPLLISLYYNKDESNYFDDFVIEQYNRFNNTMYFIKRGETYQQEGRIQNKEEAEGIDQEIINILGKHHIPFEYVVQDSAVDTIVENVIKQLNEVKGNVN